jgi:cytochrome c oxidase assembly protein subunit 15
MPAARDFAVTARLATPTAVLMLVLIVVGSVVRTTGSGLSCPDWPLCHGKLIPPFQFNILMEWFHRLLALLTGVGLFATSAWTFAHREVRSQLGGLAALCLALFFSQALLGALTVWRLLDPSIVSGHLAVALLLFAALLTLALVAHHEAAPEPRPLVRAGGLRTAFALASLAIWAQAVLGGMVSTNHASLACPDWPTCNGVWFPPLTGLVGLQVSHRYGAYLLVALLLTLAWHSRRAPDAVVRRLGAALGVLVVVQAAVGVTNVFLAIPVWVSALHLGLAAVLMGLAIAGKFRLSVATAPATAPAAERALHSEVAR